MQVHRDCDTPELLVSSEGDSVKAKVFLALNSQRAKCHHLPEPSACLSLSAPLSIFVMQSS